MKLRDDCKVLPSDCCRCLFSVWISCCPVSPCTSFGTDFVFHTESVHACAFICLIARENTKLRYIEPPVFYTDCCCGSCGEPLDLRQIVDTVIVAECVQCALWIGAKLCAT